MYMVPPKHLQYIIYVIRFNYQYHSHNIYAFFIVYNYFNFFQFLAGIGGQIKTGQILKHNLPPRQIQPGANNHH